MKYLFIICLSLLPIISSAQKFIPDWKATAYPGGKITAQPGWKVIYLGDMQTDLGNSQRKKWNQKAERLGASYFSVIKTEQNVYLSDSHVVNKKGVWVKFYKAVPIDSKENGKKVNNRDEIRYWDNTERNNYRRIVWDGPFEDYNENGTIKAKGTNLDGKPEGTLYMYDENGQLQITTPVKNGKIDGIRISYYASGQIKMEGSYEEGILSGPYRTYHENGQLEYKAETRHGEFYGPFEKYSEDGTLIAQGRHESDIVELFDTPDQAECSKIKMKMVEDENSIFYKGELFTGVVLGYCLEGRATSLKDQYFIYRVKDGKRDGLHVMYHELKIQIASKAYFKDGIWDGPSVTYYENGNIRLNENYVKGERDGYYEESYYTGQVKEQGSYIYGKKDGPFFRYHENGLLSSKAFFVNGEKDGLYEEYRLDGSRVAQELRENGNYYQNSYYHLNGNLATQNTLENGIRVLCEEYNYNGELISTTRYKDGVRIEKNP